MSRVSVPINTRNIEIISIVVLLLLALELSIWEIMDVIMQPKTAKNQTMKDNVTWATRPLLKKSDGQGNLASVIGALDKTSKIAKIPAIAKEVRANKTHQNKSLLWCFGNSPTVFFEFL